MQKIVFSLCVMCLGCTGMSGAHNIVPMCEKWKFSPFFWVFSSSTCSWDLEFFFHKLEMYSKPYRTLIIFITCILKLSWGVLFVKLHDFSIKDNTYEIVYMVYGRNIIPWLNWKQYKMSLKPWAISL